MFLNYNPQEIEKKWQERWAADHIYEATENSNRPILRIDYASLYFW